MKKPVLAVTGGTGFVGAVFIAHALRRGLQVRALTRRPQAPLEGVTWIEGDLDNKAALAALMDGAEAVIHIAAVVNVPTKAAFDTGNVTGTLNVVEAAKAGGIRRFIHVSSLAAREPQLSNYGESKAKAEAIVQASALDWTIVRPPTVYGPMDRDLLDVFKMARTGFVMMPPRGSQSVIHVDDLASLLLALPSYDDSLAMIYEADDGHQDGWTHERFAKAIGWSVRGNVRVVHAPRWLLKVAARVDRLLRGEKARMTLDRASYMCHPDWVIDPAKRPPARLWKPKVGTRTGMKDVALAYRQNGWLK